MKEEALTFNKTFVSLLLEFVSPLWNKQKRSLLGYVLHLTLCQEKSYLSHQNLFSLCIKYESSDKWLPVADSKRFSNHGQRVNESSQLLWPISRKSVPVCWQKQLSFVEKLLCTRHRARLMGWREERQSYPRKANLMKKTDKEINNLDIDKPCSS